MKFKKTCCLLLASIFCFCLPLSIFADNSNERMVSQTVEQYSDGSYAIISTYDTSTSRSNQKSGYKNYDYYDGGLAWTFTVYGAFSYTGTSVTCTDASFGYDIVQSSWRCTSGNAEADGNTATARGTFTRSSDGRIVYPKVTISCDVNGNLS